MKGKVNILGVQFDSITMKDAVERSIRFLETQGLSMIFTANPEIVMMAHKEEEFLQIINQGDMVVADGVGVVIGAKMLRRPMPERVAGYDLVQNIFKEIKDRSKTVYLFGAAPEIAKKAAKRMVKQHPGLHIVGYHDGYFDKEEEARIISEINRLKPDILLVGLGAPKQEKWIYNYKDEIDVRLCIGVGGSFDVMSGNVKRAPKFFIRLGLEWFYRLITQPTRIKRMLKLPLFLVFVLLKGRRYKA